MVNLSRAELICGQGWMNACLLHLRAEQLPQPCPAPCQRYLQPCHAAGSLSRQTDSFRLWWHGWKWSLPALSSSGRTCRPYLGHQTELHTWAVVTSRTLGASLPDWRQLLQQPDPLQTLAMRSCSSHFPDLATPAWWCGDFCSVSNRTAIAFH